MSHVADISTPAEVDISIQIGDIADLFDTAADELIDIVIGFLSPADQQTVSQAIAETIEDTASQIARFTQGVEVLVALANLDIGLDEFLDFLPSAIVEQVSSL